MTCPRAADDFATIRTRMEELRRERAAIVAGGEPPTGRLGENEAERRRRARIEGRSPPWVPTIFTRRSRH